MNAAPASLVKKALSIDELAYNLENISTDDKKQITDYTTAEIVEEAKYVLGLFGEHGHINNQALCGEEGEAQRKWAKSQVVKLRKFIKEAGGAA